MKHNIGVTRNGAQVYVELIGTRAGKHIAQQTQLLTLAKEMFAAIALVGKEIRMDYDMKRPIGYSFTVETTDKDAIFYGRLLKENVYTRFVKNGKPTPTKYLSVTLTKDSNNNYELHDIWMGRLIPPRPGSSDETVESKPYWENHALILESQSLQLQTVTKTCPY